MVGGVDCGCCQVVIVAEMPTAGGFYMSYSVDSLRLHPYIKSYQFVYLVVELLFIIFTVVIVIRTLRDVMTMGAAFYTTPRCWIDLGLATSSTFLVVVFICYNIELNDLTEELETMEFRYLFYLDRLLSAGCGFVGLFAILRGVLLCRYVPMMSRINEALNNSSAHVVSSVVFALIVWLMIASSASALFGRQVPQLRGLGVSLVSTLYATARVYHFDSLSVSYPLSAWLFIMLLVALLLLCIARSMCILGVLASFRDVSQLPDSASSQVYFRNLAQNFRDVASCLPVRKKTIKHKTPQHSTKVI